MAKKRFRLMAGAAPFLAVAGVFAIDAGVVQLNAPSTSIEQRRIEAEGETFPDTLMTMTLIDGEIIHFFTDAHPCAVAAENTAAGLLVPVELESGEGTFAVDISCICVTEEVESQ